MLTCLLVLTASLCAALLRWEAWPLSSYPMYSHYRRPAGTRVYRVELSTQTDPEFHWWRPPNHKDVARLSELLAQALDNRQGEHPDAMALLHAEVHLKTVFDPLTRPQYASVLQLRLVERSVQDDACEQLRDRVLLTTTIGQSS